LLALLKAKAWALSSTLHFLALRRFQIPTQKIGSSAIGHVLQFGTVNVRRSSSDAIYVTPCVIP
jgi:hypothetical protein